MLIFLKFNNICNFLCEHRWVSIFGIIILYFIIGLIFMILGPFLDGESDDDLDWAIAVAWPLWIIISLLDYAVDTIRKTCSKIQKI